MITISIWRSDIEYYEKYGIDNLMIFSAIIISIFAIPLDILLSPFEILTYIIAKQIERVGDGNGRKQR